MANDHPTQQHNTDGKGLLRSILTLVGGNAAAQVITVASIPIATRIFSPSEFGVFAVYSSALAILAIIASLRFEIAITLPKRQVEAFTLLLIAMACICLTFTLVWVILLLVPDQLMDVPDRPGLNDAIWLLPLGVATTGIYNALQYWNSREKAFAPVAKSRLIQSVVEAFAQITGGLAGLGAMALVGGQLTARFLSCLYLFSRSMRNFSALLPRLISDRFSSLLKEYRRFPLVATPDALLNTLSLQLSVILIAFFVDAGSAGVLFLAIKIMQAPISLIGSATAQVYLSEISGHIRDSTDARLTGLFVQKSLTVVVGPIIFAGVLSPILFPYILGADWAETGYLICWMTPWLVLQALVSPTSLILQAKNLAHISLGLNFLSFLLRCGPVLILGLLAKDDFIPEVFAVFSAISYFCWFFRLHALFRCLPVRDHSQAAHITAAGGLARSGTHSPLSTLRSTLRMSKGEAREAALEKSEYFSGGYQSMLQLATLSHQVSDIMAMSPASVLEVGIGNGFTSNFLRGAGLEVTTADINPNLGPDIVGPISELPRRLGERSVDLLVCCEVLEHLPFSEFERSIETFRSLGERLYLTLPVYDLVLGFGGFFFGPRSTPHQSFSVRIPRRKSLEKSMHFWEVGSDKATRQKALVNILERHFSSVDSYTYKLNPYHVVFVCQS